MKRSTACKSHDYRSIKLAQRGSKEGTCRVVSSTELDLLLPPIKRALLLLFGYRSLQEAVASISLVAVALDFQVFLTQTIRLKQSNSNEPERSRCCRGGK